MRWSVAECDGAPRRLGVSVHPAGLVEGTPLRVLYSGDFKTLVWRKLLVCSGFPKR
jgi:hypothetical protein